MATNWARNVVFGARELRTPATLSELQKLVSSSDKVGVLGAGHSFNGLADTTGVLVSLQSMPRRLRIAPGRKTVHVDAGMRLSELATRLHHAGLGLHTMPSLPHITIAGACSTATHGSGDAVPTLASAVRTLTMVSTEGDLITYRRGERDFNGAVVSLGALGVITELELDVVPTFDVEQYVFEGVSWTSLCDNVKQILASAYSVSMFLDGHGANSIWTKQRVGDPTVDLTWAGAHASVQQRHPVAGMPANNCTEQGGAPGPWNERLPHFKAEFTPSVGTELQSEYLVDRRSAASALRSVAEIAPRIGPLLHSMEVRSVKEDDFWLSPCFGRPSIALHFTWVRDAERVGSAVDLVEDCLSVYGARPHWAKLFGVTADRIERLYSRHDSFCRLRREVDPQAKFGNDMIDRYLPI